jgi:hypothetical protein
MQTWNEMGKERKAVQTARSVPLDLLLVISWLYFGYILAIFWLYFGYILAIFWLYFGYILACYLKFVW